MTPDTGVPAEVTLGTEAVGELAAAGDDDQFAGGGETSLPVLASILAPEGVVKIFDAVVTATVVALAAGATDLKPGVAAAVLGVDDDDCEGAKDTSPTVEDDCMAAAVAAALPPMFVGAGATVPGPATGDELLGFGVYVTGSLSAVRY